MGKRCHSRPTHMMFCPHYTGYHGNTTEIGPIPCPHYPAVGYENKVKTFCFCLEKAPSCMKGYGGVWLNNFIDAILVKLLPNFVVRIRKK